MRNFKKILSLVLAMAMALSLAVTAGAAFADGDQISADYATAVEFAAQTGILEGVGNNNYAPQDNLTRAQLATMTYRIATGDVEDDYTANFVGGATTFTDTTATAWYAGYVGYAADAGYLKGMGDGTYAPNAALTGYQTLAAFLRAIGYNEAGHNFCGADWTVQVAKVAKEVGALEGITGVDLNKAISREVAAQMLYNILFSENVKYTLAFGYNGNGETLAKDVFDIKTDKDGEVKATAPWGQPATKWFYENGRKADTVAVEIAMAPVVEYTAAVSECDLAKDLGLTEDFGDDRGEKIVEYKNGAHRSVVNDPIVLTDTTSKIGAQGTLTEVYEVEGDYWFVQIETFLAKCTDTDKAVLDKNNHVEKAATADFAIYCDDEADFVVETTDFAKDDYVLVNISKYDAKSAKDYVYYLTETAPVATSAKLTYKTDSSSTIGGETYNWAAHYEDCMDNVKPGVKTHEYDVFVDFYGNLIGLFVPAEADPVYAVLDRGIKATTGFSTKVDGELVSLDGEEHWITIASFDGYKAWSEQEKTIHDIVAYEVDEDGKYEMTEVNSAEYERYVIKQGESNIAVYDKVGNGWNTKYVYNNVKTDDNTIFVVETKHGVGEVHSVYTSYVGYKAVPSMVNVTANAEIEVFNDGTDVFADIIYVDATAATVLNGSALAYVDAEWVGTGVLDNDAGFNTFSGVVINGEAVEVMAEDTLYLNLLPAGMYTLRYNEDGLVEEAVPAGAFEYVSAKVGDVSGNEFVVNGTSFEVTDATIIWVIDGDDAKIGTIEDIEEDADILFKADYETTTAEFVIVFAD